MTHHSQVGIVMDMEIQDQYPLLSTSIDLHQMKYMMKIAVSVPILITPTIPTP